MTTTTYNKPLPLPDYDTEGFWEGTKLHQLRMKRCQDCQKFRFPPDPACPYCGSWNAVWEQVSGKGTISSFIVIHHGFMRPFTNDLPYAVIQVALAEQDDVLVYGNTTQCKNEDIRVGMPVQAVFEDVTDDTTLVYWKPS